MDLFVILEIPTRAQLPQNQLTSDVFPSKLTSKVFTNFAHGKICETLIKYIWNKLSWIQYKQKSNKPKTVLNLLKYIKSYKKCTKILINLA